MTATETSFTDDYYGTEPVSFWRFWGELPRDLTRETIRAQSIEGWNPWRVQWGFRGEPPILLANAASASGFQRALIYATDEVARFAVAESDGSWRFYLPASAETEGALEAAEPRFCGHWRMSPDEDSELPWPKPEGAWAGRSAFLTSLDRVEAIAERVQYRGYSHCRICSCVNGSEALRLGVWEWPSGFRHYIADHQIRPSDEFEAFISGIGAE
jgi:hypothetical protein